MPDFDAGGSPNWVVDNFTGDVLGIRLKDGRTRPIFRLAELLAAGANLNDSTIAAFIGALTGAQQQALRRQLLSTALPFGIPSSGTIGANGALTLTTALVAAYARAFMYFPAGAVFAGSAAGLYYVEMSSTTAGTVYNNTYSSGTPAVPAVKTPVVGAGPGAYTQVLTAQVMHSITLPGGSLGPNGQIYVRKMGVMAGTNSKAVETKLAGSAFASYTATNQTSLRLVDEMQNQGVESANVGNSFNQVGLTGSGTLVRTAINTALDQTLTTSITLGIATDYVFMEGLLIETIYGA